MDPVFGPEYGGLADTAIPCVHWHRDTFSLPAGAVHLAGHRPAIPTRPSGGGSWPTACSSTSRWTGTWPRPGAPTCPRGSSSTGRRWPRSRPWAAACSGASWPAPPERPSSEPLARDRAEGPDGPDRQPCRRRRARPLAAPAGQAQAPGRLPRGGLLRLAGVGRRAGGGRPDRRLGRWSLAVYAVSISLLFGVSALFHRHTWGPVGRRRMRRADHSTIFIAIAGSYTRRGRHRPQRLGPDRRAVHRLGRCRRRHHGAAGLAGRAQVGDRPALRGGGLGRAWPCCPSSSTPSAARASPCCWPGGWPTRPARSSTPASDRTRSRGVRVPRGVPRLHHRRGRSCSSWPSPGSCCPLAG